MATLSANSGNNTTVNCGLFLVYFKDMEYKEFAGRLKVLQDESGAPKTQYKFAEWLGLSKSFVSELLRGEKLPSMDLAISLSNKFDVNLDWLMRGKGQKHPNTEPTNHNGYLESASLTTEQLQAVKLIIAQFEQTNPVKAENKSLTYSAENVGGGVAEPSASYSVKLPTQQAQASLWQPYSYSYVDNEHYLQLIKNACITNECYCENNQSPSRDLSYAAMIARTNLK